MVGGTELKTICGFDNLTHLHSRYSIIFHSYASVGMDVNNALTEALKTNQYATNLEKRVIGIENM